MTLKRNFQIMPGAEWLAQLCAHIPDRFEHLVRYAGWYSIRSRGKRRRTEPQPAEVVARDADPREVARVRSTWARLIHKVYVVDPLECPKCKGPMRVIALIEDNSLREGRARLIRALHCPSSADPIDCHVDFLPIVAREAT